MAYYNSLPTDTALTNAAMATYIFAMGDARYYTRLLWPKSIEDAVTGLFRDCTLADIIEAGAQMADQTESHLMSVTLSIKHDPDETQIPVSDAGAEDSVYALYQAPPTGNDKGPETFQVRVPNIPATVPKQVWIDMKQYFRMPNSGRIPTLCVNANFKKDKRARASV